MSDIELKLGGGRVVRTVNGGEPEGFDYEFGFEDDEIETVDGSDIDRVLGELYARGGSDAILGRFLRDKLAEYWATVDPESNVTCAAHLKACAGGDNSSAR
jgi:hypothetical protein